ncbi:MAG TPA: hypothetical protein VGJ94_18840 [Syntrophorhabdaceae bacterium]
MNIRTLLLMLLVLMGTASCYMGYSTSQSYRPTPGYYDEHRGYPEGYWINRPDWDANRNGERYK